MNIKQLQHIVELLADGELHSGQELGEALQVTRSAIWKSLKQLAHYGIDITREQSKGYCIPGGINLLSEDKIRMHLNQSASALLEKIIILPTVDSTNDYLLEQIKQGQSSPSLCVAEHQSAGKGRRGRSWISPFGKNIYMSCSWRFSQGTVPISGVTIIAGIALMQAFERLGIKDLGIKWPNDIYYQNKKLAGILSEMYLDSLGDCHIVIGLGINGEMSKTAAKSIDKPWIDMHEITNKPVLRNQLVAYVLDALLLSLLEYQEKGMIHFQQEFAKYDLLYDREIFIDTHQGILKGRAQGIEEQGGLLVSIDQRTHVFHSGEVSIII